jgi:hypothetical protein
LEDFNGEGVYVNPYIWRLPRKRRVSRKNLLKWFIKGDIINIGVKYAEYINESNNY